MWGYSGNLKTTISQSWVKPKLNYLTMQERPFKLTVVLFPSEIQQYYAGESGILSQYFSTSFAVWWWRTWSVSSETFQMKLRIGIIFIHLNPKTSFKESMSETLTRCAFSKRVSFQIAGQFAIQVFNKYLLTATLFPVNRFC